MDPLVLPDRDAQVDNICPSMPTATATPLSVMIGQTLALHGESTDDDALPSPLAYAWTAESGTLTGASKADATFKCISPGEISLVLTVTDGACEKSTVIDVTCEEAPPTTYGVVINEIESSSGMPGDWVELYNTSDVPVDISHWIFRDSDDTHLAKVPLNTMLGAHEYFIMEEMGLGFGLGAGDSVRVYDVNEVPVDSHMWTAHAMTTLGRCPNGTGDFSVTVKSTKGAANTCTGDPEVGLTYTAWPGADDIVVKDGMSVFGGNISDLAYDPSVPVALWAVQNDPSRFYRIVETAGTWGPAAGDWAAGKALHYADGMGSPDAEGITIAETGTSLVYVVAERDNAVPAVSRLSVLLYDTSTAGTSMTATKEWNLTADFDALGPNAGIESIAWIPDVFLLTSVFMDEHTGLAYVPTLYPNHGTGLFFIAAETGGVIRAYALNHADQTFTRVATIQTGMVGIMGMTFDRDNGYLWAHCDDACANRSVALEIDLTLLSPTVGKFILRGAYEPPASLGNFGFEGVALAPEATCASGKKAIFFVDDANTLGHALRVGTIPCGVLPPLIPIVVTP